MTVAAGCAVLSNELGGGSARYIIPATDTDTYGIGDVVSSLPGSTNGRLGDGSVSIGEPYVQKSGTRDYPRGFIVGFARNTFDSDAFDVDSAKLQPTVVYVCDDPNVLFEIYANNTAALEDTVVGQYASPIFGTTSGSVSGTMLDVGSVSTVPQMFRIHGISQRGVNAVLRCSFGVHEVRTGPQFTATEVQVIRSGVTGEITPTGNALLSGGQVAFLTDLTLIVSTANYLIQGDEYVSPQTTLTAATADPTNPRIDVVAVNDDGEAILLTGTPGVNPEKPQVDPASELELTFFLVAAGATDLDVTTVDIYQEGVEWTPSTNSPTRINLTSTNNPFQGTVDVETTSATTNDFFAFGTGSPPDLQAYDSLVFYIRNKSSWGANRQLDIRFYASGLPQGNTVVLRDGVFAFSRTLTGSYQQIVIPLSLFGAAGSPPDAIRFFVNGSGGSINLYFDACTLQAGLVAQVDNSRMRWTGVWDTTRQYAVNDVVFHGSIQYVALLSSVGVTPGTLATTWQQSSATPGAGAVTSVGMSVPSFLSVAGSPVTSSGTLAVSYSGTALPVANGGSGQTSLTAYAPLFGGTTGTGAIQSGSVGTAGYILRSNGAGAIATFQQTLDVANGGTGRNSFNAYGIVFGGTTGTGALQESSPGAAGQVLISNGSSALPTFQEPVYQIVSFHPGIQSSASEIVFLMKCASALNFPANYTASVFTGITNATASTTFDVLKNGSIVGTVVISAGSLTATFATSGGSQVAYAVGDTFAIRGPATADTTLEGFSFTFDCTRQE